MKALLQRVRHASVAIDEKVVGEIGRGLLVFLGIEKEDDAAAAARMVEKLLAYRVFADEQGRMNLSVREVGGGVLLISQFTLAADTRKGLRPSFSSAAEPERARALYARTLELLRQQNGIVASGEFAADMQVSLCNDGPVTFLLEV